MKQILMKLIFDYNIYLLQKYTVDVLCIRQHQIRRSIRVINYNFLTVHFLNMTHFKGAVLAMSVETPA